MPNEPMVDWMCTKCGKKTRRTKSQGRPDPGKCPKNSEKNHSWVVNKR